MEGYEITFSSKLNAVTEDGKEIKEQDEDEEQVFEWVAQDGVAKGSICSENG